MRKNIEVNFPKFLLVWALGVACKQLALNEKNKKNRTFFHFQMLKYVYCIMLSCLKNCIHFNTMNWFEKLLRDTHFVQFKFICRCRIHIYIFYISYLN